MKIFGVYRPFVRQLVSTFLKLPKTKTSKNFQLSETFARPFETLAIFSKHLKEEGKSF